MSKTELVNFKVSSYLKTILGKDLITDDYVAIFELVKNSFDAKATRVSLCFEHDQIIIIDNGKGMSRDDILQKWVFVAYSAKREGIEDPQTDYRERFSQRYAGSKGVGRFSCDRLGAHLVLQTKTDFTSEIQSLNVNWTNFETSSLNEFQQIPLEIEALDNFDPKIADVKLNSSGTALVISQLRSDWDREKILGLKSALSKLINPFGNQLNDFTIEIVSKKEESEDERLIDSSLESDDLNSKIVNGVIQNFIFETLEQKTTRIKTWLDNDGVIYTELIDRGKLIYRISETLQYPELIGSEYECSLYYLNRSAKSTFSRRMGIPAVNFGSIFLFKNGFRIYPTGNVGDDTFGIDRRKQQGYARYLGTRDLLGRIDIKGDDTKFRESSSRDKGLIETEAYFHLIECFKEKSFLRLENYVVGVSWKLKYDQDIDEPHFLSDDEAKAKVIDVVSQLCSSSSVNVEYYASDLLTVINNKISGFEKTIAKLEKFAIKLGDHELASRAKDAVIQYEGMQRAEADAIAFAEREKAARQKAEKQAQESVSQLIVTSKELQIEKEKNLFFISQENRDKDILENLHHQVIIYASNAINHIEASILELNSNAPIIKEKLKDQYTDLLLIMQRVISASRFATSANFKMEASRITEDLPSFIKQYVERICPIFEGQLILTVKNNVKSFVKQFKPIEVSIIIDNLIDNARKAAASSVNINIYPLDNNVIGIDFIDDGHGLSSNIPNSDIIFEKGVTTTGGSGIGLYHVKTMLLAMNGDITFNTDYLEGGKLTVRIYK